MYVARIESDEGGDDVMFGFFRRKRPEPEAPGATMFDDAHSRHDEVLERIGAHIDDTLETLGVDVHERRFTKVDGTVLSLGEFAREIHEGEPSLAVADIEEYVIDWLWQAWWPEGVSEARMEKLQEKIEDWIEAYRAGDAG